MFGQTYNFDNNESSTSSKRTSRLESLSSSKGRSTPSARCKSPSSSRESKTQKPKSAIYRADTSTERYSNLISDRNPSRAGRQQGLVTGRTRPLSGKLAESSFNRSQLTNSSITPRNRSSSRSSSSRESEKVKFQLPSTFPQYTLGKRKSEIINPNSLRAQCRGSTSDNYKTYTNNTKPRPKTAETTRFEKVDSNLESRIFNELKVALSQAVIEKGKIDEDNFSQVIQEIESRIKGTKTKSAPREEINGSFELTHDSIKLEASLNNKTTKGRPVPGIFRRNFVYSQGKIPKVYNKVYADDLNEERVMYIDLPDFDVSNFNEMVREENKNSSLEEKPSNVAKPEKRSILKNSHAKKNSFVEENSTGDCKVNREHSQFSFWKAAEEENFKKYVEDIFKKLVRECGSKTNCSSNQVEEDDRTAVCTTICSSKGSSKGSVEENKTKEDCYPNIALSSTYCPTNCAKPKIFRQYKTRVRGPTKSINPQPLERTKTFVRESKTCISSARHMMGDFSSNATKEVNPKTSYVVMSASEDENEDMYLKRRLSKGR